MRMQSMVIAHYSCEKQWIFGVSAAAIGVTASPVTSSLHLPALSRQVLHTKRCRSLPSQNHCSRHGLRQCVATRASKSVPTTDSAPAAEAVEAEPVKTPEELDEEARKDWWERGWAPWEEIHPPENQFALKSVGNAAGENPRLSQEVMDLLKPKPPPEPEPEPEREIPDKTYFDQPLVFSLIPPRDWPPPGWKVDPKELAFIRETHTMYQNVVVTEEDIKNAKPSDQASLDRWNTFVKQYKEWVAANKERLDQEALEADIEYEPGRRRTGSHYYCDGMYELPFIYPGQHYWGVVVHVDLHDGAFVYIGAVHDGWVPIRDNDWYKLRHHIKVGTYVQVEVIAKRDPYRYRFPIQLRFVDPNIDKYIFRRFKYPPIISRPGDKNLYELARETGRPCLLDLKPIKRPEDHPINFAHPYVFKIWQLYAAEEMKLDEEERKEDGRENEEEEKGEVLFELTEEQWQEYQNQGKVEGSDDDDDDDDDDEDGQQKKEQQPKSGLIKIRQPTEAFPYKTYVVRVDDAELDLDAARAERQALRKLYEEAEEKGEEFVEPMPRRQVMMEELNRMHQQRCAEEIETLKRDITCRVEAGLRVEDERYSDDPWGPNKFNSRKKIWQCDYIGDPKETKQSRSMRRDRRPRRTVLKRSDPTAAGQGSGALPVGSKDAQ